MTLVRSRLAMALGGALLVLGCDGADAGSDDEMPPTDDGPDSLVCGDETLAGHVVIESEADLAVLDGVRVIEGELQVNRTALADLDDLGCIEEVGGELTIFGNTALTDIDGLDSLERVGGGLVISENPALEEVSGLPRLAEVEGTLVIRGNDSLRGVSGFDSLTRVGTSLIIRDNDVLEHIDGLRGLRAVGSLFAVTHNPNLCISSVNRVGEGIVDPAEPRDDWSTRANDDSC